jgi:hypothetical protein
MLVKREAKNRFKCTSCGGSVRTCEKYWQAINADTGRNVRGGRYCVYCEDVARENNPDTEIDDDWECERGLRERETYAAYQANGCASAYFDDRQAGY